MKLTKKQRDNLRNKYGGRCAYCGCELPKIFHADHFEPVDRICVLETIKNNGVYKLKASTVGVRHPERNDISNMMPSCVKCNISKSNLSLEKWRTFLERTVQSLRKRGGMYAHAVRFGLIVETNAKVKFYFERVEGSWHRSTKSS